MASVELILLQRVEKLGQMGEVVKVRPGYARNFLLPQAKAVRATKANRERFEPSARQLEAQNLKRRDEAERVAERVHGLTVMLIRQAGDSGACTARSRAATSPRHRPRPGLQSTAPRSCCSTRSRRSGWRGARRAAPGSLHPVNVNVARSPEEAEKQARGRDRRQCGGADRRGGERGRAVRPRSRPAAGVIAVF